MKHILTVNGRSIQTAAPAVTTLLEILRDHLQLVGTKKGCGHGQCGACTVLVDGERVLSCLQLAATVQGPVVTIEGLAGPDGHAHPVQEAFLDHEAFQCGYCTPGQIMSAIGALSESVEPDRAAIAKEMSGNLCRCAAYPNIVDAVLSARQNMEASK
ncbi:MAG: (2Fe-2S)-binding protein [Pseudomonadota bacterium]